jgi:hypothetical protein
MKGIETAARSIADNIDNADLETLLDEIARQNSMPVEVTDETGGKLFGAGEEAEALLSRLSPGDFLRFYKSAQENGGTFFELVSTGNFGNRGYMNNRFVGPVPAPDNRAAPRYHLREARKEGRRLDRGDPFNLGHFPRDGDGRDPAGPSSLHYRVPAHPLGAAGPVPLEKNRPSHHQDERRRERACQGELQRLL